ncbi:uncharacterized protein [Solanum lycopersicum]|uniref:DUF4408 domain-containing protein n=1 Tax=Solanum lycopersicum TaxID=4081 RepID=A0A3Q7ET96_SOLLC|nr:uncharacterized protein LOC101244426 [Solanum lycopersicum]
MESLNIKLEKANAMLRYKKRQRVTTLFRFIEFCIFFAIISRFSTQLPLNFKGLGFTIISPRFVFVLGNIIVIILFLISGQSSTKDGSTNNVKIDMYDEFKQKCLMNKDTYCEQSKKQSTGVQDTCCCEQSKKQRTLLERQLEKKIHRSHSDNSLSLSLDEKKPRKKLTRSATLRSRKVINTDSIKPIMTKTTTSYPEDEMSNEEFKKTVENFIARQQRFLREEEFSAVVSYES